MTTVTTSGSSRRSRRPQAALAEWIARGLYRDVAAVEVATNSMHRCDSSDDPAEWF